MPLTCVQGGDKVGKWGWSWLDVTKRNLDPGTQKFAHFLRREGKDRITILSYLFKRRRRQI